MPPLRSDRWYSADGQRRSQRRVATQSHGTRRLISLCFLLALVIMLMQKAADPRHVRNAFDALGVPLEPQPSLALGSGQRGDAVDAISASSGAGAEADESLATAPESAWETSCQDLLPRLLDDASHAQILALAEAWFATSAASPPTAVEAPPPLASALAELAADSRQTLAQLKSKTQQSSLGEADKQLWLTAITRFEEEWQTLWRQLAASPSQSFPLVDGEAIADGETKVDGKADSNVIADRDGTNAASLDTPADSSPPQTAELSPELMASWTQYLDDRLLASLRDAAPWSKAESLAFWRLLQRGQGSGRANPADQALRSHPQLSPLINTLQLESEADVYRGQVIRFVGSVRRAEYIARGQADFGVDPGYWLLWLRGGDDALQPVAVYTTDAAAAAVAEQLQTQSTDFPQVAVQAIAAKRLAYASQSGVQVAPTLFATQLQWTPPVTAARTAASPQTNWQDLQTALWAGLLLAGAIVVPIVWRWRQSGRQRPRRRMWVKPLLWIGWCTLLAIPAERVLAQSVANPPWADASHADDAIASLLQERLRPTLDPAAGSEFADFMSGAQANLPDALLQVAHSLDKVGWRKVLQIEKPLPLDHGFQLQTGQWSGWVRLAMPLSLNETQRSWFQVAADDQLYRLELQLQPDLFDRVGGPSAPRVDGEPASAAADGAAAPLLTVFCRRLPEAWLTSPRLRQPVVVHGMGLWAAEHTARPLCVFADLPTWVLPEKDVEAELAPPLEPHLQLLGKRGWNLAWADMVRRRQQQPIGSQEMEALYSMLRVASNAAWPTTAADRFDPPLNILAKAPQSLGKRLRWRVRLVSGSLVQVSDPSARDILGGQDYVQFDGFVDVGREKIRYQLSGADGQPQELEFAGEFPVTIVTRADTPFISQAERAAGQLSWQIGQYAAVDGLFYRLWSYQSELVQSRSPTARQAAPLVVAIDLRPSSPAVRSNASAVGWFGFALCGATVAFLGVILVLAARKERPRRHHTSVR